jgi:hypothetical protein
MFLRESAANAERFRGTYDGSTSTYESATCCPGAANLHSLVMFVSPFSEGRPMPLDTHTAYFPRHIAPLG